MRNRLRLRLGNWPNSIILIRRQGMRKSLRRLMRRIKFWVSLNSKRSTMKLEAIPSPINLTTRTLANLAITNLITQTINITTTKTITKTISIQLSPISIVDTQETTDGRTKSIESKSWTKYSSSTKETGPNTVLLKICTKAIHNMSGSILMKWKGDRRPFERRLRPKRCGRKRCGRSTKSNKLRIWRLS
jgi:hypothetical protein